MHGNSSNTFGIAIENVAAKEFSLTSCKFVALRSFPSFVITDDDASQFKIVKTMSDKISKNRDANDENLCKIEWKFIPELSPLQGRFYERLIAFVENCLKKLFFKLFIIIIV